MGGHPTPTDVPEQYKKPAKKWLPCLKCGKPKWGDAGHRIHKRCKQQNEASGGQDEHHVALPATTMETIEGDSFWSPGIAT